MAWKEDGVLSCPCQRTNLHGTVIELQPVVVHIADMEHEGVAEKQMFVAEARSHTAEVE